MDKKIKISATWAWMIVLFLVILGVISLMHMMVMRHAPVEAPVPTGAASLEPAIQDAESPSQVNMVNSQAPVAGILPPTVNPNIVKPGAVVPDAPANVNPPATAEVMVQDAAGEFSQAQATQGSMVVSINAPMSDEQILAGIHQANKKQQAIDKIVAGRDAQAVEVMRHVAAARSQPAEVQQAMPSSFSNPPVPADIKAKLKAHQLTAH